MNDFVLVVHVGIILGETNPYFSSSKGGLPISMELSYLAILIFANGHLPISVKRKLFFRLFQMQML
jgi:hypothetical protein